MICAAGMPLATVLHALTHLPAQVSDTGPRDPRDDGHSKAHSACDLCSALDAFEEGLLSAPLWLAGTALQHARFPWSARSNPLVAPRWFEPRAPPARSALFSA
ncbi:hypothetical protein CAL22_03110 [Bordetella genomosp. 12]|uniref:DUF2946 domain-containing protein n=2 Tax=Bordetella genomosp. 12 TaxID=463035 RepID=A0A261VWM1_9BORD|nr:hypothetical protein CAL22_03110 [Bordetella genomosp. 12]